MKKMLALLTMSILIVAACGQNDDNAKENTHNKTTAEKKGKEHKEDKNKDEQKDKVNDEGNKQQSDSETSNNQNKDKLSSENQQIDLNNITDRETLESIIYGNYNEMDKIKAYNSAVSNGIIPQGNVMEGPASAAYESSLRVESGAEQSVYKQNAQSQSEAPAKDVNAEINAAQTEDEYIDALRKKYNGGLSSAEMQTKQAIEQGYYDGDEAEQQAVYDEIERREADIKAGKFDHYKQ